MPNKKARKRNLPAVDFDLDPAAKATNPTNATSKPTKTKRKRNSAKDTDDTPKAFARMMAITSGTMKPRKGLDEGKTENKKRKRDDEEIKKVREGLKIKPNETLRDFGRRVDAAIPVKFLRREGKMEENEKEKEKKEKAKKEKKTKEEEDLENMDLSEEEDPEEDLWADDAFKGRKRRSGKKKADSPDPWAELEAKRVAPKFGEVAEAPPALKKPKEVFKVYNGAKVNVDSVPRSAGSLAKREELAGERNGLIEKYRKMMVQKRADGNAQ